VPTGTTAEPEPAARRRSGLRLSDKIALNSSVQAARQLFIACAGIVSVAVATRYLTVDQYGGIIAALVLVSLFSLAADFGITAMTVRAMAREPENDVQIVSSAFWVWVMLTIPTGLAIFAMSHIAYGGPEHAITRSAVLILLCTFVFEPFAGVASARAIAEQRVWLISLASIAARAVALLAIVLVAIFDLGPLGIAMAFASGFALESIFSIAFVHPRLHLRAGLNRSRIRSLVIAAIPLGTIMVINGLYFKLDAFLLSLLGSTRDLAIYGVAYKAFDMLLALPGFVMITLLPELARLPPDSERFNSIVQKAFTGMCLLVTPILGLSLLGGPAIIALGGSKYGEGGSIVTLIVVAVCFSCVQGVFGNTLVAQGKQAPLLRVSITVLVANGLLNLAAIPLFGVHGAALVLVASEIISLVFTMVIYRRIASLPHLVMPGRMLLALLALVAAISVRFLFADPIVGMLVAATVGLVAYIATLKALGAVPSYMVAPAVRALHALRLRRATT
jgi:O-antigen/teichoic acid export membrane protein